VQAVSYLVSEFQRHIHERNDITVSRFQHSWAQNSIIAKIHGEGPHANEVVIIGAHLDSISSGNTAPGADDDGSGTCTVLEVFRILATSGFKPKRTLEFHGYSAEEVGLRGSQDIAQSYSNSGVNVYGMMQLDMTGYVRSGTTASIAVITDFVSPALTAFTRQLIDTYTSLPWINTACGYACSDHASWSRAGFLAVSPTESTIANGNPNIHTTRDVIDILSPSHMLEITKLALAYAVEMSLSDE